MFSSRLDWNLTANPLTRLLERKRAAGAPILDLTESNPTRAGLRYSSESVLGPFSDERSLRYDPTPAGLLEARSAVARYYSSDIDVDRIVLTTSTSESYGFLFKLLANPGDEVLVPRPSYPLFEFLAALESVRVVEYPLVYHGAWAIDLDALAAAVTPRTRAVMVVNPNNPTGSFLKKPELERLVAICDRHGLAIISDEVFADYAFGEDPARVRSLTGVKDVLAFSLSGLSKLCGLPQMKLGWMVASGPAELRKRAVDRLELIADTYLSVSTPVQWAAAALLELREPMQRQIRERVTGNLAFLKGRIGPGSPWSLLETEGGWYAIVQAPRIYSEEDWTMKLLEEENVLVQPGFFFDFEREAFLVMSLLTPTECFREGVDRILKRA